MSTWAAAVPPHVDRTHQRRWCVYLYHMLLWSLKLLKSYSLVIKIKIKMSPMTTHSTGTCNSYHSLVFFYFILFICSYISSKHRRIHCLFNCWKIKAINHFKYTMEKVKALRNTWHFCFCTFISRNISYHLHSAAINPYFSKNARRHKYMYLVLI